MEAMVIGQAFWCGKKVFITGHTGFKGSWLSLWLQRLGAQTIGYSLDPPTRPSLFELARVADAMVSVRGDIRDLNSLCSAMVATRPEIVIHMAAQSLVRPSYKDPVSTYETNVIGTVNLLEAVRRAGSVRAVVNVTSDKCYENREWVWGYRETDPMGGHDPYSSSKGCAELVTAAYRNSYFHQEKHQEHGVSLASVRAGNVVGGGDWAEDRLVPDIVRAINRGIPVNIRNPHAIRPWQHVLEPLFGYLLLAQLLYEEGASYGDSWNFGPDDEDVRPVQWIVETLCAAWGEGASWVLDMGDHAHEAHHLKLDCSKAKAQLGWRTRWSLRETLAAIVEWHRAYGDGKDMREITLSQIEAYTRGASIGK